MKQSLLGRTDVMVSAIGLGTVKIGRNQQLHYPQNFALPSDRAILDILALAREMGINLVDTAPAYGMSEERLGKLLKGQRQAWVVSTKVGEEFVDGVSHFDFSAISIRQSILRSLKRLQTDYLDIVLVHSNGEDKKIIEDYSVFSTLAELKAAGVIRAFGMSTKTVEGGILALDHSDVVMVTHNPVHNVEQAVIAYAHQHQKGILVKKALVSGHLDKLVGPDPILTAMQFVFQQPGIHSVVVGTLNPVHLRHIVECAEQALS